MPLVPVSMEEVRGVLSQLQETTGQPPTLYEEQEHEIARLRADLATTQEMFEEQVRKTQEQLERAERAEGEIGKLRLLLERSQYPVCANLCPSVKKEGQEWAHYTLCLEITEALKP